LDTETGPPEKEKPMKKCITRSWPIGIILATTLLFCQLFEAKPSTAASTTLEVYDPTGAVEVTQLFAPRLPDLHGKTVCELSNASWEVKRTFPVIRELLQKQFPTIKIIPYTEFADGRVGVEEENNIKLVAKKGCQAVIVGNGG
jgi:hypothetical protein